MKAKNLLTTFLVCFLLTVCSSVVAKDNVAIQRGMSKQDVLTLLGEPENISFNQYSETWEYYKSGWPLHYDKRRFVSFDNDGRVLSYRSVTLRPDDETENVKVEHVPLPGAPLQLSPIGEGRGGAPRGCCMDEHSFSILYNKVRNASFDSNKYDLIEVASLGGFFSCDQCIRLMQMFTFDDKKMQVLRFMAPHIVDPQNATDIYRLFTFNSDKEKAARLIQNR